jgi:hypothetical protein
MSIQAIPSVAAPQAAPSADQKSAVSSPDWEFSFNNLLDIINPLEHLPVISTLYRAITGTHIGMPEKIAGDALYGGLWGAVASVADTMFEAVTGKDFGSTVLAIFTGSHQNTQLARNVAATPKTAPSQPALPQGADMVALQTALDRNGVDADLARRAMDAYRKSIVLPTLVAFPAN